MDKKLTDNLSNNSPILSNGLSDSEIVKALECCRDIDIKCETCQLWTVSECTKILHQATIDLINRLQAENERLMQELQYPQADTVQPMSEENIVHCKECKHLMFSDFEGECSKGYKGIVRPNDSCPFGVRERRKSK
jgi:hypothetical protein